ncbi:hypothetical protein N4G40_13730 [Pantoea eucrina]|uniref:Uncharacterized protein n=1 Tax=Pantoea eucrina TaxID=472693 RepID=A0ABU5LHA4_9GAMM|nr:hypothetical protein [Pantoea eucrina]
MNLGQTAIIETGFYGAARAGCHHRTFHTRLRFALTNALGGAKCGTIRLNAKGGIEAAFQAAKGLSASVPPGACIASKNRFAVVNNRHNSSCE